MALSDVMREASSDLQDFVDANPDLPQALRRLLAKLIGKMEAIRVCYDDFHEQGGAIPEISDDWEGAYRRFVASRGEAGGGRRKWQGRVNKLLERVHSKCENFIATEPDVYIPRSSQIKEVMDLTFEVTWPWEEWEYEEKPR